MILDDLTWRPRRASRGWRYSWPDVWPIWWPYKLSLAELFQLEGIGL